jgi:predicted metal-dependent HD superfamily phosphohydrolase
MLLRHATIFAKSPEEFDEYERQVRGEYQYVPIEIFRSRRAEILEGFLRRDGKERPIYRTGPYEHTHEKRARANLERSIRQLREA